MFSKRYKSSARAFVAAHPIFPKSFRVYAFFRARKNFINRRSKKIKKVRALLVGLSNENSQFVSLTARNIAVPANARVFLWRGFNRAGVKPVRIGVTTLRYTRFGTKNGGLGRVRTRPMLSLHNYRADGIIGSTEANKQVGFFMPTAEGNNFYRI